MCHGQHQPNGRHPFQVKRSKIHGVTPVLWKRRTLCRVLRVAMVPLYQQFGPIVRSYTLINFWTTRPHRLNNMVVFTIPSVWRTCPIVRGMTTFDRCC
jgi:hypothetical protein